MSSYTLDILVNGKDTGAKSVLASLSSGLTDVAKVAGGVLAAGVFDQLAGKVKDLATGSISLAGDFEAGMNNFSAVTGASLAASGKSVDDFKNLFLDLGKKLPVSTSEVQQAAIEMAKGGIDPATIAAGGLEQVLQFAAAGGTSLADAATVAAKAVGGWVSPMADASEKAAFLTHSTDLIARAANASTVDVNELALGLYNVQGTAKTAGVSFDETVTTLAMLSPAFSSSADAATSLKVMLSRLAAPTGDAVGAMRSLGLFSGLTGKEQEKVKDKISKLDEQIRKLDPSSKNYQARLQELTDKHKALESSLKDGQSAFYDSEGSFLGMENAALRLHDATKGLDQQTKITMLTAIGGQDAVRALATIADQGADGYNAMSGSMASMSGVSEMAAQKQAGFNTAWDNFQGSIEALQISLGSHVIPLLTKLLNNVLAPGVNAVTEFADSFFQAQDKAGFLATALSNVSPWLEDLVISGTAIVHGFSAGGVGGALAAAGQQLLWWAQNAIPVAMVGLQSFALQLLNWGVAALPGWLATLGMMGAALIGWIVPRIPELLTYLLDLRNQVFGWALAAAPGLIASLASWSLALLGWIEAAYPSLLQRFTDGTTQLIGLIGQHLPGIITSLGDWALALAGWVVKAAPGLLANLGSTVGQLLDAVGGALPGIVTALAQWGLRFGAWVLEAAPPMLLQLAGLAGQLIAWIGERLPFITAQLLTWGTAFGSWIDTKAIPYLQEKLPPAWAKLSAWISETTPKVLAKLLEWGGAFGDWIATKALPWLQEKLPPLWNKISTWVGETTPKVIAKLLEWGAAFGDWIATKALPWLQEKLPPLWDKISTWVGETTPKVIAKLLEWGAAFGDWIATKAVPYLQEKLPQIWSKLTDWAGERAADAAGLLRNTGNRIVDGLWTGISEKWDQLKRDVGGLFTGLVDWVKGLLGIHSPSLVFANQIGAMLPAGMAVGVTANAGVAQNAVADVASSLMPAAAGALSTPFSTPNIGVASGATSNATSSSSGQPTTVVYVTVQGSVISERDLGLIVRDQFEQMQRRNGALGFG